MKIEVFEIDFGLTFVFDTVVGNRHVDFIDILCCNNNSSHFMYFSFTFDRTREIHNVTISV